MARARRVMVWATLWALGCGTEGDCPTDEMGGGELALTTVPEDASYGTPDSLLGDTLQYKIYAVKAASTGIELLRSETGRRGGGTGRGAGALRWTTVCSEAASAETGADFSRCVTAPTDAASISTTV